MEHNICVIGAGVIGLGVVECLVQNGYNVWIYDNNFNVSNKISSQVERNIMLSRFMPTKQSSWKGKVSEAIHIIESLDECSQFDYIIENITEDIGLKKELYTKLNKICKKDCIFMVNTSCVPITKIASYVENPERVIGTHFMNPVPMISAIEVIVGFYTSDDTIERVKTFLNNIGKEVFIVKDAPGFVSNRISHLMMNEAIFLVESGVADCKTIDEIFKKCYGHKMGPLETADLIGLDTVLNSLNVLYESYQDPKFRSCPLLNKMVDAGLYGRKSKKGFYEYIG